MDASRLYLLEIPNIFEYFVALSYILNTNLLLLTTINMFALDIQNLEIIFVYPV